MIFIDNIKYSGLAWYDCILVSFAKRKKKKKEEKEKKRHVNACERRYPLGLFTALLSVLVSTTFSDTPRVHSLKLAPSLSFWSFRQVLNLRSETVKMALKL